MQGLVLQLTRVGFLLLLWLFIWSVLRILRTDLYAPTGAVMVKRGLALRGTLLPSRQRRNVVRQLIVTEGALAGTRITLGAQPVLIGRADDSTLVLTDDYASTRHARLSPRGSEWYVEDLGSTNGTYLDRAKVTPAVRVPMGTPVPIGKTVIALRAAGRVRGRAGGMGGRAAGEVASQLGIAALAHLDDDEPGGDLLSKLDD